MSLHYNKELKANESTSKLKEVRDVVLVLACHPSNTTLTHSLSFTLMAKIKTRRSKLKQLQFLATKHKLQLYSLDLLQLKTPGGIYRHQGKGATWVTRGPKRRHARAQRAAKTRPRLCFHGPEGTPRGGGNRCTTNLMN